ncbi:F-box/LRR-repeat protein 15-like [Dreissena polymorpha]|uniref:F-box/LRR-repeat protein 15-like n=1 Tax=Dreissena polymorpha TaxID=45954 RepID=UPI002264BC23|nr:F-box/LRR-repeat protein 15-like [Dreissena polymorpha]
MNKCGDTHVSAVTLFDLPVEDVIFQHIFPLLPIQTLFHARCVCRQFQQIVQYFFTVARTLNIARIGGKVTERAFHILTDESSNLVNVNLRNAKDWLQDSLLMPVLKNNQRIESLDLTNCTSLSNTSLQVLVTHCVGLKSLVLRDCVWLDPDGVTVIGLYSNQLEKIDMSGCWNVNDEALVVLVKGCPRLLSIELMKIYGLTDTSMSILCQSCPKLVHLNVQGCWRITDDSIRFLAEYGKNLKTLHIRDCTHVTETVLTKLRQNGVKMDRLAPPSADGRMDKVLSRFRHKLLVQT